MTSDDYLITPASCSHTPRQSLAFQRAGRHPMPWSLVSFSSVVRLTTQMNERSTPLFSGDFGHHPTPRCFRVGLDLYTPKMFGVASIQLVDSLFLQVLVTKVCCIKLAVVIMSTPISALHWRGQNNECHVSSIQLVLCMCTCSLYFLPIRVL